jgi:uncharacterized protein (UPF0371 family)
MSEVRDAAEILIASSRELDDLSKALMNSEKELAPIERELEIFVSDFQVALYDEHRSRDERLPSSEIRLALAYRAFDRDRYNRYLALKAARVRARQRIGDLKGIVDAQRSILSALKTELEASEGPQPQWTGGGQ